jgi:hypothetical protein
VSAPYAEPVARLFTLGTIDRFWRDPQKWLDYRALGVGEEHAPELVRLLGDPAVLEETADPGVWAMVHAWRAVGQLRAEGAPDALVALLYREDDDWITAEVPAVLGMIGAAAMPALRKELPRLAREPEPWGAAAAADAMVEVARAAPEVRGEAVAALSRQLDWHARQDAILNGLLVASLVDLEAVEAAGSMEAAFAAEAVDLSVAGDWEEVQLTLGLIPERTTPRPHFGLRFAALRRTLMGMRADEGADRRRGEARAREQTARRKKAEKKARKRQRGR